MEVLLRSPLRLCCRAKGQLCTLLEPKLGVWVLRTFCSWRRFSGRGESFVPPAMLRCVTECGDGELCWITCLVLARNSKLGHSHCAWGRSVWLFVFGKAVFHVKSLPCPVKLTKAYEMSAFRWSLLSSVGKALSVYITALRHIPELTSACGHLRGYFILAHLCAVSNALTPL